MKIGDTVFTSNSYVILEKLERVTESPKIKIEGDDLAVQANLQVKQLNGQTFSAKPIYYIHQMRGYYFDDELTDLGLVLRLTRIVPEKQQVILSIAEKKAQKDFIVLTAIVFPFINLLWLGTVITIAGFFVSIVRTLKKRKTSPPAPLL